MKPIFQKSFSLYLIILLGLLATNANAQTWTIGTGTTSLNGRANPFCLEAEAQRVQFLYTNADLNAAGVPAGNITSMQFFVDNLNGWNGAINPFNGYTIRLYNTTVANLSGGWVTGTSTLVFNGNINSANGPSATGWHTISFSSTFNRAVNNGIVVEICFNSNTNVATLQSTTSFPTVGQSNIGVTVGRREFADNSTTGVCSSTGGVVFNLRPSIRFTNQPCPMGGPVAGTVTGPATACINSNVALTLTGASVGSAFAYQWQRNINSAGWTNEGTNATSLTIAYTGVATQYRVIVSCVGNGASATSTALTVNPVAFTSCYCAPVQTGAGGVGTMSRVIFAGINNVSGFAGFTDYFSGTAANVSLNGSFPITVETTSPFPGVQVWVWIDYNQNAIFDVSERVQLTECGTPTVPYNKFCGIINVPPTALSGTTKMRIRYTWSNLTVANPACTAQYNYGEVEDYKVIIAPSVACSGAPDGGGNTLAGSTSTGFDFSATTFTGTITGPSITARAGAIFTANTGATFTGTINGGTYTGTISGTTLTITAVTGGSAPLAVGTLLSGGAISAGTAITALGTGSGGTGTYTVNNAQTIASTTITGSGTRLTVSAVSAGNNNIGVGMSITGAGIAPGTTITALGTGTGGTGTYTISSTQLVASTTISGSGNRMSVTAISSGALTVGMNLSGAGITPGTTITAQVSGGAGSTGIYTISNSHNTPSITVAGANNVLTVTALTNGPININTPGTISGPGIAPGTAIIAQVSGTPGQAGVYTLSAPHAFASTSLSGAGTRLTVTTMTSGQVAIGMFLDGPNVAFGTTVTALGTGTGGTGTYIITPAQLLPSTSFGSTNYVCPSSIIYLSTQTFPNNGSISFQWEMSADAGITWNDMPGATLVNATYSGVPLGGTYMFRRRTTCTISGQEAYSTPITVLGNPSFVNCYCTPVMTDNSADRIDRVSFNGYTRTSTSDQFRYSNTGTPTAPVSILNIGTTYPVEIQCGPYTGERASVWVDLNTDADFDDPGEWMGQVQFTSYCGIPAGTGPANNIRIINVTIPAGTAPAPYTRMRVRIADPCQGIPLPSNPWTDACSAVYFGETEDYGIQISVLPVCSGTPTGGTTVSSIPNPCQGTPFVLSVTGASAGETGLSYQWESNSGSGWSNILGANALTLNVNTPPNSGTIQYRRRINCVNSGLFDYSSTLNVSSVFCGCQPSFTTGTSNGYFISSVELENSGLSNTSGANTTAPFYQYFTTVTEGIVQQGAPYWLKVVPGTNAGTHNIGAWIDWNADNDFNDAGEQVGMQATSNSQPVYFLINVPVTANLGLVRMR
ncbi:MAG: beta strand repeat-containing protein, partial [Bacteroidota bacterium]